MNNGGKVGIFAAGLCVVFGAAIAIGNAVGPVDSEPAAMEHGDDEMTDMPGMSKSAAMIPGGLQVAQDGYRLVLDDPRQQPSKDAAVTFTIFGPDGDPLTDYATLHDKQLHFIVAKRDLTGFQHVHPDARRARHLDREARARARPVAYVCRLRPGRQGSAAHARRRPDRCRRVRTRAAARSRRARRRSATTP